MDHLNPQAREMADESMVRTLAAQADAIWPQEQLLFGRYQLPAQAHVLDAGCGTGEISTRLVTGLSVPCSSSGSAFGGGATISERNQ